VENPREERLRITHWDHRLARNSEISHACSAPHVREILEQWIILGRLPAAFDGNIQAARQQNGAIHAHSWEIAGQSQPIGELAIHRHEIHERSEILKSLLDAVFCLVQNESYFPDEFSGPASLHTIIHAKPASTFSTVSV
jgi:hypothetical protein